MDSSWKHQRQERRLWCEKHRFEMIFIITSESPIEVYFNEEEGCWCPYSVEWNG